MKSIITLVFAVIICASLSSCSVSLSVGVTNRTDKVVFLRYCGKNLRIPPGSRIERGVAWNQPVILLIEAHEFHYISQLPDDREHYTVEDLGKIRIHFELRKDLKLYLMTKDGEVGKQPKGFPLTSGCGKKGWINFERTGMVK